MALSVHLVRKWPVSAYLPIGVKQHSGTSGFDFHKTISNAENYI